MRIVAIAERTVPVSRYADPALPSGGLTTSLVAVTTDVRREGRPVVGYGYASVGRFGQGGLIRERFAPRLLAADAAALAGEAGVSLDPLRAWAVMMDGEKPGGHGERCVAVGALDMAIWDAAAKIAGEPLAVLLARRMGRPAPEAAVRVYAGGGYPYPTDDLNQLQREIAGFADLGFTHAKIKIGATNLLVDGRRIETAARQLPGSDHLAVDAMNRFDLSAGLAAADHLSPFGLWWFEDICDPHDFATQAAIAAAYPAPIAAGEALFSVAEARLLDQHGGLRRDRDILVFDPAHCYGLSGYCGIVSTLTAAGWPRRAFWPHGGHLFALHVVAGLGLGGAEVTPYAFAPFRGLVDGDRITGGRAPVPQASGIGFERHAEAWHSFASSFA